MVGGSVMEHQMMVNIFWVRFDQLLEHVVVGHTTVTFVLVPYMISFFPSVYYGTQSYSQCYFCCILFAISSSVFVLCCNLWTVPVLGPCVTLHFCNQHLGLHAECLTEHKNSLGAWPNILPTVTYQNNCLYSFLSAVKYAFLKWLLIIIPYTQCNHFKALYSHRMLAGTPT